MKEVKSPKKPLIFYYGIVLVILLVFNMFIYPLLMKTQVKEVDYGTFMKMINEKNIGEVEVADSEIIFTDKDKNTYYKTGAMDDPGLTERLYDAGAVFSKNVEETVSPVWHFLLTFLLPIIIFIGLGQYFSKKLIEQAGGKNALSFGMARAMPRYMCSQQTVSVSRMSQERMKQKRIWQKSLIICTTLRNIRMSVLRCQKVSC